MTDSTITATKAALPIDDVSADANSLAIMQADMQAALLDKQLASADGIDNTDTNKPETLIADAKDSIGAAGLDEVQLSRVIEMAWEDRTPFAAIEHNYGLNESAVIDLMRQQLKPSSFKLWRERVTNRATKHEAKRSFTVGRGYCKTQYKHK